MYQSHCMVSEDRTSEGNMNSSYDVPVADTAFLSYTGYLATINEEGKEFEEENILNQCDATNAHDSSSIIVPWSLHNHLKSYDERYLQMSLDDRRNLEQPTFRANSSASPRSRRPGFRIDSLSTSDDGSFHSCDSQLVTEGIKKLGFNEVERINRRKNQSVPISHNFDVRHPASSNPNAKCLHRNKVQPQINPNRHNSNKENVNPVVDCLPRTSLQTDTDCACSNTGLKTGKTPRKKQAHTRNLYVCNRVTSDQSASPLKSPVYSGVASTQAVMSPVQSKPDGYLYSKKECTSYMLNKFLFGDDESSSPKSQLPDFQNIHESKSPSYTMKPKLVHSASSEVLSGPERNVLVSPSCINSRKVSPAKVTHSVKSSSSNLLCDQLKKYVQFAVEGESSSDDGQTAKAVLPGKSSSVTQLPSDYHFPNQHQNSSAEPRTGIVTSPNSRSSVYSVVVLPEFRFRDCCIGLSTQDMLPIYNPSEQWVRVDFKIAEVIINGKRENDLMTCPFSLTERYAIQPKSTANLKIKFAPRSAGVYVAQLQLRCCLSSTEEDDVFSSPANKLPIMVTLQAVAEKPLSELDK